MKATRLNKGIMIVVAGFLLLYPVMLLSQIQEQTTSANPGTRNYRVLLSELNNAGIRIALKKHKDSLEPESVDQDTSNGENRITNIYNLSEDYKVKIKVEIYDSPVKLFVFNMLAKKVLDIYEGQPIKDPEHEYIFNSSSLPNGMYLCILQGKNFRHARKFIVSR